MRTDKNGWKWVTVEWLLEHTTYSYDFGSPSGYSSTAAWWRDIIEDKALDGGFLLVVESLQTHGWMSAINVEFTGSKRDQEVSLVDGHHRLVAAILLCMDEVPLWDWSVGDGIVRLPGCPSIYTYDMDTDEDSLLLEAL